jgi:O-antigen ligase
MTTYLVASLPYTITVAAVVLSASVILYITNPQHLAVACAIPAFTLAPMIALRATASITISDVCLGVALAAAAVLGPRCAPCPKPWRLTLAAVGLMLIGGAVSTLANPTTSSDSAVEYGQYLASAAAALGLVFLLRPGRGVVRLLAFCYATGTASSAVVAALQAPKTSLRPVGLTTHPNHLGLTCALGVAAALAVMFSADTWRLRLVAAAVGGTALAGVVLSGSRAGVAAVAVASVGLILGSRSGRVLFAVTTAGCAVVAAAALGFVNLGRNNALLRVIGGGTADEADAGRAYHYARGWARIQESPILGTGFANARDGHSLYLQMWDSAGLFGVAAAILLVAATIVGWVLARRTRDVFAIGMWSSYGGYLVAAVASNQMWDRYLWLTAALAMLATASTPMRTPIRRDDPALVLTN